MPEDDVTLGELGRSVSRLDTRVEGLGRELAEIKVCLAGQAVKVGVVWSALGLGVSALITSIAGLVLAR